MNIKTKSKQSPNHSMFEMNSIFKVMTDDDQEQLDTPNLSSLVNKPQMHQMNTSMTTKISNHILDNEIRIKKRPLKVNNFSSVKACSSGVQTVVNSGITSALQSG